MEYKIVKKFRKTVLVDENGKTIATAPHITRIGSKYDRPVFAITDKDGLISVFDGTKNDYILTGATAAKGSPIIDRVPMIFSKGKKTLYVSPKTAKVFDIPATDTLCFAISTDGKPSHKTVFQVHDGKPYPLHAPDYAPTVARYPQGDTIENVYSPLMIKGFWNVRHYMKTHADASSMNIMAKSYAAIEGQERVPEYLQGILDHFREEVIEGTYTLDNLGELIAHAEQEEKSLEDAKKEVIAQSHEKARLIDQVNTELKALGYPIDIEGYIYYMSGAEKRQAQKKLDAARQNPIEEVAVLLAERETLEREQSRLSNQYNAISLSQSGDAQSLDNYLFNLTERAIYHTKVDELETSFEILLSGYGMKLPEKQEETETKATATVLVESAEETFEETKADDKKYTPPAQ